LARPDDTILDTQVLNDASSFFLQFTESDYGTYDYKLLLSKWTTTSTSNPNIPPESYWVDTVIATHTQLFPRPEPTFTTSWTKSGLTINADLSSITGAHPEFYAYLCRDDGTTLATHQFQTGQTTTSLSFTEADYGSFTYQLKLGTTVVSTHTETYVRPTPTYTASFSTNELTLTASITSITNAHNSFAITLERDDGTVLQTHTLAENETSFNFTQTETSYATFNYIVKLNGTQTDTYSATYTPPPTPTFDIALTNDELTITATLTNIVNPDPYYTLMIHDANDTHLDGHTFTTSDTTVTLTWTETSYGEKTYTKLLNGASIGTETITLTDPNTSFTFPEVGTFIYFDEATWGTNFRLKLLYAGDVYDQWAYYRHDPETTYTAYGIQVERSTGIWIDWGNEAPNTVNNDTPTTGKIQFENQYNQVYTFTNPYPTSTSTSTPTFNPPTGYTLTGPPSDGYYPEFAVNYDASKQTGTKYYYGIGLDSGGVLSGYYFYWDSSNNTWNDAQGDDGTADPVSFSYSATPVVNGTIITGIGGQGADFIFTMSGIVSSSTPPPTQITDLFASHASGGEYGPAGVYTVIHSSSTPTLFVWQLGNSAWGGLLADHTISYDTNSKIWADVGSGNPYYVCDGSTWADTTASSANQQTLSFWQSSTHLVFELTNPYYEAPTSVPSFNAENGGGWNGGVSTFYRYTGFTGEPTDGYVYTFAYNGVSPGNTSETIKYSFANGWEDYPLNSTTTNPFSVNTSDGSTAIGGTIYPANTIVGLDTAGNFLFKFGHNATYPDPYYEAPPTIFPSSISFTGSWDPAYSPYYKNETASTDTSVFYDLNIDGKHGIEFRQESDGSTSIYANTGDNDGSPASLTLNRVNGSSSTATGHLNIEVGDVVSGGGNFTFTITSSLIFTY
jgi:hypothetical protein